MTSPITPVTPVEPVIPVSIVPELDEEIEEEEEEEKESEPPKIAKVLYDYEATLDDDITVHENDNVIVIDDSDIDWWKVRVVSKNGKEGMVPSSYIKVMVPGEVDEEPETYEESTNEVPPPLPDRDMVSSPTSIAPPTLPQRPNMATLQRTQTAPILPNRPQMEEESPVIPTRTFTNKVINRPAPITRQQTAPPLHVRSAGNIIEPDIRYGTDIDLEQNDIPTPPRDHNSLQQQQQPVDKYANLKKPLKENLCVWTDKTGSFNVEAEFLGLVGDKVHLHKANGVKIAVPLDKLDAKNVEFIKSLVDKDHKSKHLVIPPPPASSRKAPEVPKSNPPARAQQRNKYTYRGFNWKNFFVEASIEEKKAEKYAKTFVHSMLNKSIIKSLDESSLATFNIDKEDIPSILKYIKEMDNKKAIVSFYYYYFHIYLLCQNYYYILFVILKFCLLNTLCILNYYYYYYYYNFLNQHSF